jgi:hypothetical protein
MAKETSNDLDTDLLHLTHDHYHNHCTACGSFSVFQMFPMSTTSEHETQQNQTTIRYIWHFFGPSFPRDWSTPFPARKKNPEAKSDPGAGGRVLEP